MRNQQVGSYWIAEKLAAGGMGEVYLAHHEFMERHVVVKVLHPSLSHEQELVTRFFNEARAADSIQHPGIVKIYDVGYAEGRAYIVMERLYGETLAQRMARQLPPVKQAVSIIRQLAGALGAAHACSIVHRDLKPENIFVVPEAEAPGGERIKVLDFGVAKLAQTANDPGLTAQGAIFGTPSYMAPEQCSDAATVDHRADLYAIGCIFYELLCGQPPFGKGGLELLAAHLRDAPVPPSMRNPAVSEDLEELILRLLAKNPAYRLQSCEGLIRALDGADINPRRTGTLLGYGGMHPELATLISPPRSFGNSVDERTSGVTPTAGAPASTTHLHASGQVRQARLARGRKTGLIAVLAILIVGAVGAGAVALVMGNRGTSGAVHDSEPTRPKVVIITPPDARIELSPEHNVLHAAKLALDEHRWEQAKSSALQVLAMVPENTPLALEALDIERYAEEELDKERRSKWTYDDFMAAATMTPEPNILGMVDAYQKLPESSEYREEVDELYIAVSSAWLKERLDKASALKATQSCAQILAIEQEVRAFFPEMVGRVDDLYQKCRGWRTPGGSGSSGTDSSGGMESQPGGSTGTSQESETPPGQESGSETSATGTDTITLPGQEPGSGGSGSGSGSGSGDTGTGKSPPSSPDDDLPAQVPRQEILDKLKQLRTIGLACVQSRQKTKSLTVTIEIATTGRISNVSASGGRSELKRCLSNKIRGAKLRFSKAREVTTVPFRLDVNASSSKTKRSRQRSKRSARPVRR